MLSFRHELSLEILTVTVRKSNKTRQLPILSPQVGCHYRLHRLSLLQELKQWRLRHEGRAELDE